MNFKRYHVSRNLFDKDNFTFGTGATIVYVPLYVGDGFFTLSTNFPYNTTKDVFLLSGNVSAGASSQYNGVCEGEPISKEAIDGYVTIATRYNTNRENPANYNYMLNSGSTALPYEPYSSQVWHDIPHYIHNTSTDTITTPAVIYPNGTTATVGLKGNMEQSGTPFPITPIQPQECGERTGNLVDFNALLTSPTGYIEDVQFEHVLELTLKPNTTYTMSSTGSGGEGGAADTNRSLYFNKSGASNGCVYKWHPISQTTDSTGKVKIGFMSSRTNAQQYINGDAVIMLNEGSDPLPYEPYGVKIPILNNSQTTNVYLGEVQSTRRIKKLVLTGQEDWKSPLSDNTKFYLDTITPDYLRANSQVTYLCTHYISYEQTTSASLVPNLDISMSSGTAQRLYISDNNFTAVDDFKTYLQQQYTNGTPVTVWYVLATPTTGIVNEPIRKIGDYADTVSGITIPTIAGANVVDVLTTLKPSEVSVNYHGWHPVADVHERENGAWT